MACGDEGTAAFIFLASAGTAGGPAGACASTLAAVTTAQISVTPATTRDTPRILTLSFFLNFIDSTGQFRRAQLRGEAARLGVHRSSLDLYRAQVDEGFSHRHSAVATKCLFMGVQATSAPSL
jgi:hypothetical protein